MHFITNLIKMQHKAIGDAIWTANTAIKKQDLFNEPVGLDTSLNSLNHLLDLLITWCTHLINIQTSDTNKN